MEVVPNIHLISRTFGVNVYLIVEDELTLIDTGFPGSSRHIIRYINKLGRSEKEIGLIIITHNHLDHTGGLANLRKLTSAQIAVHEADTGADIPYSRSIRRIIDLPLISLTKPLIHKSLHDVDILIKGGEELSPLGGLKVIHTPGHTPGSISLFSPQKRILFSGDMVNTRYDRLRMPDRLLNYDTPGLIRSVLEISKLDFDVLCVGHGKPIISDAGSDLRLLVSKLG